MVRAEAATVNPLEKTRLLHEAGKIFQEKLGDDAQAAELFARVLQLDPEHVEAARAAGGALLQARGVGAAGADPRDAGPQGGSQDATAS